MRYFISFCLFFTYSLSFSQDEFYKTVKGNIYANPDLLDLIVSPDNRGYAITFSSEPSENDRITDENIIRYNACDEIVFQKRIKNIHRILEAQFVDDFIVLAATRYNEADELSNALILLSPEGEVLLSKSILGSDTIGSIYVRGIDRYEDGSYIVNGNFKTNRGNGDMFFTKISSNYEVLWTKILDDGPAAIYPDRVKAAKDGGLIYTPTISHVIKLDSKGDFEWHSMIGRPRSSHFSPKAIEVDDGIIFAGSNDNFHLPTFIYKLNNEGGIEWVGESVPSSAFQFSMVRHPGTGNIWLYGRNSASNVTMDEYIISEFNSLGKVVNQVKYNRGGGENYAYIDNMESSFDDYIMFSGFQTDSISNFSEVFIVRSKSLDFLLDCSFEGISSMSDTSQIEIQNFTWDTEPINFELSDLTITSETINYEQNIFCFNEIPFDESIDLGDDIQICFDGKTTLTCQENLPYYKWSTGETTQTIEITDPGTYWVEAGYGCYNASDTIVVEYFPEPLFDFHVSHEKATPLDEVRFISKSEDVASLSWEVDNRQEIDSIFSHYFNHNGIFPVYYSAIDKYGCSREDSTSVLIEFESFFLPNSFSPNGDGINDTFGPKGFGLTYFHLNVYNRWGDLIFSSDDTEWDGGKAQDGNYIYQLEAVNDFGDKIERKGQVVLRR